MDGTTSSGGGLASEEEDRKRQDTVPELLPSTTAQAGNSWLRQDAPEHACHAEDGGRVLADLMRTYASPSPSPSLSPTHPHGVSPCGVSKRRESHGDVSAAGEEDEDEDHEGNTTTNEYKAR